LCVGADANLVVLDRDLQVAGIMADGEWQAER
jgi:N-acetylglucosamine-6-phosphate deacetylase